MSPDLQVDSIVRDLYVVSSAIQPDRMTVIVDLWGGVGQQADADGAWAASEPAMGSLTMALGDMGKAREAQAILLQWQVENRRVILLVRAEKRHVWMVDPSTGQSICLDG